MADTTTAAQAAKTVQVLLDDYVQKPSRSGSPGEIIQLLMELRHSSEPAIQMFMLFIFIAIVMPFIGGCLVLLHNFTKEDKNRPPRAFSWIPFIGAYVETTYKTGEIFSVDTIVRESTCLFGEENNAAWNNSGDDKARHHPNQQSDHITFIANQMGKLIDPAYRANSSLYWKHARDVFSNKEFYEANKDALDAYLSDQLTALAGRTGLDLFALSSAIYLHTMLFVCFGDEFARLHGEGLVDELHNTQLAMRFTFVRFVGSFGLPTSAMQSMDKLGRKLATLVEEELAKRVVDGPHTDYLQHYVNRKSSQLVKTYVWSHIAHLILACHAPTVAATAWTSYELAKDKKLATKVAEEFGKAGSKTLNTCLTESSRLYGPVQLSRVVTEKFATHGFNFYPGMTLFIAPAAAHLSEENYPDPMEYKPERWLKSNAETAKKRGRLVTFNGNAYGTSMERFLYQVAAGTTFPLLHQFGLELQNEAQTVTVDYWATISAPWASEKIPVALDKSESKKQK
ncbi:hypothetical protein HDU91_000605 [Kappamyces sp. JEL0680]|nr:hypothetical protein HDU91_000605 [Kappamyces sp. JEL0680]